MNITGANFIGFKSSAAGSSTFRAFAPAKDEYLPEAFTIATEKELQWAVNEAARAFQAYRALSYDRRAAFLDAIAREIMDLGNVLIERCSAETGLPVGRLTGERKRTCDQLQLFAKLLRDGWWVDARIDKAQPERQPLPAPDIRRMLVPLGPVAVFGAGNFPLAFSTAGGDTASALAAGCPVVVKSHPSHPGTNALVASAIIRAAQQTAMPEGIFSSLSLSHEQAIQLVQHPGIKAVGFTGSRRVGMALFHAAVTRAEPVPVYAEMSAVNPVILFEGALRTQKEKIAKGLSGSVTMGAGQFCTKPGLVIMKESNASKSFLEEFAKCINTVLPATMLSKAIYSAYSAGVTSWQNTAGITSLTTPEESSYEPYQAPPVACTVSGRIFLADKKFSDEVFGPATLIIHCKNEEELKNVLQSLEGQLTATIHATAEDEEDLKPVTDIIIQKAGRIIYGGYPTGVEVCHAMQHGGPFPSTTDARSTSVGTAAIYRFVRPVAYQDFPDHLLPEALQNANPLNILRLVDGNWTKDPVQQVEVNRGSGKDI
ncbi:2,5-dioxovalerate dehydrogenase [Niabella ginsenosidivorans]|uniref:2,5-dioxovalerate dehydrogenase n=1 Tax=Niabella ginsenosidivorans TaxID=1176587 RepID=A0A1A9I7U3_9BACT|nr:aldehyde dehydrogenase (NADP(+)) [Niabella ginsenosidivorans]ANH82732.1 2,5-dioxovalerate dehydrogenase [Niabella ginsenosidivorans]